MATKDISDVMVVRAAREARRIGRRTIEVLADMTGQPVKVCDRAIARAIRRGYCDCGVSTATAWVLPAGYALLGMKPPTARQFTE